MDPLALPGYAVEAPLDAGSAWRARQEATGRAVLLRWVELAADPAARDAARRVIARVAGLASPYLLPVHTAVTTSDGLVVVYDYAPAGTLTRLLSARQRLEPGEVVTLGSAVADALAVVHVAGLVHGSVTPDAVHLALDGTPLLADVGLPGNNGGSSLPGSVDDVRALVAMCRQVLGAGRGEVGPGHAPVLAALDTVEGGPAEAAGLATALRRAAPGIPIRLTAVPAGPTAGEPTVGAAPEGPRVLRDMVHDVAAAGRPLRRIGAVVGAATAAVLAAVALGVQWAHRSDHSVAAPLQVGAHQTAPTAPTAPTSPTSPTAPTSATAPAGDPSLGPRPAPASWRGLLDRLDRRRAAAFASVDAAAMLGVDAARSAALRRDRSAVETLRHRGARARGLRWELLDVRVDGAGPPGVTLRVTDRMPAYDVLAADGTLLARRPARGTATWRVTLLPGRAGWRISDVSRA